MRVKVPGWLAWAAVALAVVVAGLIVFVHTPPAARWVRDYAVRWVKTSWQLDLETTGLRYNLLTRRFTLDDVRLSVPGHRDLPVFAARRVQVTMAPSVFRGRVELTLLDVSDGRVLLVRENGTLVNLPPSSGNPPPLVPRKLDLRGLRVNGLAIDYQDRSGDSDVSIVGLTLALDQRLVAGVIDAHGTLHAERLRVRLGERETTSGAIDGGMTFDGTNIDFGALTVPLPEARVVVDGRIQRVLDDTRFDLRLHGSLDLERVAAWTPPPTPVSGPGTFDGTFTGPLNDYQLTANFASDGLRLGRRAGLGLTGTMTLTSPQTVIDPFVITATATPVSPRDGVIEGTFTYRFGTGQSDLDARFRDLDLDVALAAYDREPMAFIAWQTGTATIHRDGPAAPMVLRAAGTSRALTRADRIAVDGTWDATLEREQWRVRHDHRLLDTVRASGTMAWPSADDPAQSPLSGPLTVEIGDVGPMVRAARGSGIDLSAWLMDVAGPAHGDLVMDGSMARLVIRGHVASSSLTLPTTAPATADADIVYDGDTLQATAFDFTTPGARLTGDVVMGMESGALKGTFRARADDLPALAAPFAALPTLAGSVEMQGTIGGTTAVPDVPFTLRSTALTYDGQTIGVLESTAHLRGTVVDLERTELTQDPGRLTATGRVDYLTGAYDLAIEGRDLAWTNTAAGAPFERLTAQVTFAGAGTFAAPGGSGTILATPTGGTLGDLVGDADVRWQFAGGQLRTTAFLPRLRAWTEATVEPRAPYAIRGVAAVSALDIQPFARAAGAQVDVVTGTIGMSAAYDGRLQDTTSLQAFVNLQAVDLVVGTLPVRLDGPARLTVRADDFSVDDLTLRAGRTTLTAAGHFRDVASAPLKASLVGDLSEVATLARAFGALPDITATGGIEASWESRGGLDRAQSTIAVSNAWITPKGLPAIEALNARATFDGATVVVDPLTAQLQGGTITGTARLPRAVLEATAGAPAPTPGRVDVTVTGLTQQALSAWLPPESLSRLEARVGATLGLDVTSLALSGLKGALVLDEAAITAAGVPVSQDHPSRLSIANGAISFDDVALNAGGPIVIAGRVSVDGGTALDLTITGTPALRPLSVLSPTMALDGAATVDLTVTGSPEAPRMQGQVDLTNAEAVLRDPRVLASDVNGAILFEGDQVRIPAIRGSINGGDFEVSGEARVFGVDAVTGEFTFQARGVAVEYPQNVDSEIDALLLFRPGPGDPSLRGDVRVLRGAYRATISLPALVAFNATRSAVAAQPGYTDRLRLDLSVTTEDDIVIDNNYGRFEAGANVRLQGTGARPSVTGRAELREGGEVFVLGGLYRLNESSINFTNPNAIEPELNISMVSRLNGADQTLTLTGTLNRLETSVVSSDPSADTSVAALLLGGNASLDQRNAVRLLSGELLGVTGRAIGLDSLRLERGFNADDIRQDPGLVADTGQDPATRLTLSKQVRADVEVVLSQGIGEGSLSGYVSYRPVRGVELRGTSLDNTDRLLSVRHDISFGGQRAETSARRTFGAVASVTFDGAAPGDEAALRDRLRLNPGDAFDFIRWRDDSDRLRKWYHDRRYFEARVRARRADLPDGRVALTYAVERGPLTELVVRGMDVSGGLRRRLEATWSNSVFDRFLLEEIKGALWFELIQRNVVNAVVEATVDATPERKVITATVRDGHQVQRRRLVFTGNAVLTASQLEDEVAFYGLSDYGWLSPQTIADTLVSKYASEGYHGAIIEASEPTVVGTEAHLTVAIQEGPLTTVTAAALEGDDQPLAATTLPMAAALEGKPYRPGDLDTVAREIEDRYRTAGYNDARVTHTTAVAADAPTATVRFDVTPGREQRLAEVVVSGADRTHPSAVVTALRLKAGEPVDLAQWAQARKRVYDMNVFRQVDVRPEVMPQAGADGSEAVRARVTVTEWPTWRLRYGLQFDDRTDTAVGQDTSESRRRNLGVVANLQNRNVFGRAWTAGVSGLVARRLQSSNTYLTFPTLFGRAVQTNVYASASRSDRLFNDDGDPLVVQNRTLLSLEQRVRRGRSMSIVYGYRVIRDVLDGIDPDDPFYQSVLTGRFTGSALVDRRDDPFNATRGWFSALTAERVSEFESNGDTIKVQGSAYRYQTWRNVTLASALRFGVSFLDPLTIDPFYVGGADTVRGYPQDQIGPRSFTGAAGGNAMLVLNQEVRTPIFGWVRGVAFVDAGNVFAANADVSLSTLKIGYGLGLRLHTPFAVFRIDMGVAGSDQARSDGTLFSRKPRFYFGLGQVF